MIPSNINELNQLLQESYPSLSKKMKLIAFYIVDQPQNLAINTLAVIADVVYPRSQSQHFYFLQKSCERNPSPAVHAIFTYGVTI